ncbi:unnamed protein product [Rhodiola kirilowii]
MGRAPCCDKDSVKRGPWSPEEDAKLKDYIDKYGTGGNWIALPQKIGLQRCGKSCRLRWLNYLRPNIKHGGFTEEEDNIICSLYISIGSRWSIIAAQLPGRTDNDIKNYWNTRLKKKLLGRRKQANNINNNRLPSTSQYSNDDPRQQQTLSNSALERLQLHLQLQPLQNPNLSSFHNNPSMWPKLHPLQEKMIQHNLQFINKNDHETLSQLQIGHVNITDDHYSFYKRPQQFDPAAYTKIMTSIEAAVPKMNTDAAEPKIFQDEYESFLNSNKQMVEMVSQVDGFDCFKEVESSTDQISSFIWWSSNEFDSKSASSTSWDSTSQLPSDDQIFGDYAFGIL